MASPPVFISSVVQTLANDDSPHSSTDDNIDDDHHHDNHHDIPVTMATSSSSSSSRRSGSGNKKALAANQYRSLRTVSSGSIGSNSNSVNNNASNSGVAVVLSAAGGTLHHHTPRTQRTVKRAELVQKKAALEANVQEIENSCGNKAKDAQTLELLMTLGLEVQAIQKRIDDIDSNIGVDSPSASNAKSSPSSGSRSSGSTRARPQSATLRPSSAAPRPPSMSPTSLDPDFTQYKFVDDSNAIELEIEELTAKAVVLEESLDMIEADWKGKPMDKATLDVVTTLGLERSDIMRKLDSLQKQKRLMELERDRRNRTRIINKTLKAVTTRPSEAPDSPAPLPNNSVSNSDDFETDAASSAVAAMRRHSGAHETDASDDEKSTASTASTRSGSRVRHRTKVSRRRDLQAAEDESTGGGGASEDSSPSNSSQVVVKHRVRRPSSRAMSSPVAVAVESESLSASAPSASSPLKKMSGSGEKSVVGNVNHATLSSSGGSGSIVERLRAAAAAKEAEKKRLQESRERETTETK